MCIRDRSTWGYQHKKKGENPCREYHLERTVTMSRNDAFSQDLEKTIKLEKSILSDVEQREANLREGRSTAKLDAILRGQMKEMAVEIDNLERILSGQEADPARHNLGQKDLDKRRAAVDNLRKRFEDLTRRATSFEHRKAVSAFFIHTHTHAPSTLTHPVYLYSSRRE
eukprot:TRINITY_DN6070_c0_g3_i2.p1 TRINITY_DN6070_c0_g3~~TRINITY_DN6070_c0_g3_i2.p1  ORF type:complete len:196 (-),score=52.79 TRINITY_DN6070_c0_g3_i2:327-833(-)